MKLLTIIALAILALTSLAARAATPIILNQTRSAATGDVFFLQGDSFGAATRVQYSYNSGSWANLVAITSGNNALTARIPFLTGKTGQSIRNLVTVRVYNGTTWSAPAFINRAHAMSYDTPEVASGSTFRIFGRDLYYAQTPPVTPTVRLVDRTTLVSLPATVTTAGSSAYVLNVTAPPSLVAGDTYDVYVSNGYKGSGTYGTGETKSDESLLGRTGGTDVWNLGVPWGADFSAFSGNVYNVQTDSRLTLHAVGDGVNNDQPAIQAALTAANQAGGGVVYLPAGTYKLVFDPTQTAGLMMLSNVVLEGAGMGQTTVQYGYQYPGSTTFAQNFCLIMGDTNNPASNMGLVDVAFQNMDTTGKWQYNLYDNCWTVNHNGQGLLELFLQRVRVQSGSGAAFWSNGVTKMAVENSDFEVVGGYTDTWLGAGSNSIFRGNTVHWSGGGAVSFGYTPDIIVENNHFIRDCNYALYQNVINTRCFDTAFNKNLVIQNNTFDVINGPPANHNDGETISSEGAANGPSDTDAGAVSSATATTMTDTTKNWTVPNDWRHLTTCFSNIAAVAIVGGKGTGEWQMIVPSTSPNTLTVATAWTVTPDSTSKYIVTDWACENWLIAGNALSNNRVGIQLFFCSVHDTAIVGNTLTNDNGILIQPAELDIPNSPPHSFAIAWNNQMIGNTVTNSNGTEPAYVGLNIQQLDAPTNLGTEALGLEIRGNTVNGSGAAFANYGQVSEGYWNEYSVGSDNSTVFTDYGVPAILGTIFQDNTANNCNTSTAVNPPYVTINGAFRVTSGAYQTVLQDNIVGVAGTFLEDDLLYYYTNRSVGTYGSTAVGKGNNWMDIDIGSSSLLGNAGLRSGVFTVNGGGGDIFYGSDNFNSCYQTLTGNGTIIARVTSIANTNNGGYSKAGVMIRAALTATSAYADMVLEANGYDEANYRLTDGANAVSGGVIANAFAPYWVKVVRVGSVFTSSTAPDNSGVPGTWTVCGGPVTITMPSVVYAGLVVSSGTNNTLNTSTFDHVTVTSP